jgi:hypothetical protein
MGGPGDNPLASVPRDWIPLAEAEACLNQSFDVSATSIIRDLVTAIRAGRVEHRVAGINIEHLRQDRYSGRVIDPPGLDWYYGRVRVIDWDAAKMDWVSGTVEGMWGAGPQRQRLTVELYWPMVEAWAAVPLLHLRETHTAEERASNTTGTEARGPDVSQGCPAAFAVGGATPYRSKAERTAAQWWRKSEAIAHIQAVDGCSKAEAERQFKNYIQDHPAILRREWPRQKRSGLAWSEGILMSPVATVMAEEPPLVPRHSEFDSLDVSG